MLMHYSCTVPRVCIGSNTPAGPARSWRSRGGARASEVICVRDHATAVHVQSPLFLPLSGPEDPQSAEGGEARERASISLRTHSKTTRPAQINHLSPARTFVRYETASCSPHESRFLGKSRSANALLGHTRARGGGRIRLLYRHGRAPHACVGRPIAHASRPGVLHPPRGDRRLRRLFMPPAESVSVKTDDGKRRRRRVAGRRDRVRRRRRRR